MTFSLGYIRFLFWTAISNGSLTFQWFSHKNCKTKQIENQVCCVLPFITFIKRQSVSNTQEHEWRLRFIVQSRSHRWLRCGKELVNVSLNCMFQFPVHKYYILIFSIVTRFKTGNVFTERHTNTIGVDFSMKTLKINNKRIKLQIWVSFVIWH